MDPERRDSRQLVYPGAEKVGLGLELLAFAGMPALEALELRAVASDLWNIEHLERSAKPPGLETLDVIRR